MKELEKLLDSLTDAELVAEVRAAHDRLVARKRELEDQRDAILAKQRRLQLIHDLVDMTIQLHELDSAPPDPEAAE